MYLSVYDEASLIFFFSLFIYFYFWLCWVFASVLGPSPVAVSGGHSSSRCAGLSLSRPLVAEHRLQTRRLSSRGSRAQPLHGMWDLPRPGLEPVSPALAGRLSTTAPPGKPASLILMIHLIPFLLPWDHFRIELTEKNNKQVGWRICYSRQWFSPPYNCCMFPGLILWPLSFLSLLSKIWYSIYHTYNPTTTTHTEIRVAKLF